MAITDNFNRADGSPGANWTTTIGAGCSIASNTIEGDSVGTQTAIHYSGSAWNDNQSSQALNVNGADYSAVSVRGATTGGGACYVWFNIGSLQECVGGSFAEIASISSHTTNHTIKITATGTTIEVFRDTVSQGSVTDASLVSGAPGICMQELIARLDDWEGTGEAGGAAFLAQRQKPVLRAVHRASIY